jgi:hypothetical protein
MVSGPAAVTFADASVADTTATFSSEGVYTLRLTVSDGLGSNYDDIVITIEPATTVQDFIAYISNPAFGLAAADQGFNDDPDGDGVADPLGGSSVTITIGSTEATTTVTATASGAMSELFLRVRVKRNKHLLTNPPHTVMTAEGLLSALQGIDQSVPHLRRSIHQSRP